MNIIHKLEENFNREKKIKRNTPPQVKEEFSISKNVIVGIIRHEKGPPDLINYNVLKRADLVFDFAYKLAVLMMVQ